MPWAASAFRLVSRPRQSAPPFVAPRIGSTRALNPAGGAVRVPEGPARLPSDGHPTLPSKRGMELTVWLHAHRPDVRENAAARRLVGTRGPWLADVVIVTAPPSFSGRRTRHRGMSLRSGPLRRRHRELARVHRDRAAILVDAPATRWHDFAAVRVPPRP